MTMQETMLRVAPTTPSANLRYTDPSNRETEPQCIYYYHVTPSAEWPTKVYFLDKRRPIRPFELKSIVTDLAQNAHRNGHSPSPCGWDFTDLIWRRKSYLVILLDDPDASLVKGDGLLFGSANNHTFLDGGDLDINVSSTDVEMRSAIFCINHMMNEAGQDLGGMDFEIFHFRLNTGSGGFNLTGNADAAAAADEDPTAITFSDDSGTNMGPPVPPP